MNTATSHQNAIGLLIDRSGSMSGAEQTTVEAVNGFISQMQADPLGKAAHFTMMSFDSQGFDPVRRGTMSEVKPLQVSEFVPRAATPLFDAVGDFVGRLSGEGRRVLVVLTDGLENCSKKFTSEQVRALIEAKRKAGWVVIYLAANIDAWKQAEEIGVPKEAAMNYKQAATTAPPAQPGQPDLFTRFSGRVAKNPLGYALGTAALLGLAYLALRPGEASAEALGFSEVDRNAAMGVDGVDVTWPDAVADDVANFVEPVPSDSIFDLPPEAAEAQASLPEDFDPAQGSISEGVQAEDTGADILGGDTVSVEAAGDAVAEEGIFDSIASAVGDAVDTVGEAASSAAEAVGDFASGAVEVAGEAASGAVEVAGNIAAGAAEVAGDVVGSLLD